MSDLSPPVWLQRLQKPQTLKALEPLAARFIYALRLMALHKAAGRDPASELSVRLGSVTAAIHAIELSQSLLHAWPEPVTVNRFCCQLLSHDEVTIARMITAAGERDFLGFSRQIEGLVRHDRIRPLWEQAVLLIGAEMAHAACDRSRPA